MLRAVKARLLAAIGRRPAPQLPEDPVTATRALAEAHALMDRGDAAGAERIVAALEASPDGADFQYLLARLAQLKGDADAAVEHFENTVRLQPGHVAAHVQLAKLYVARRDVESARQSYEAALRAAPDVAELHARLGALHLEASRYAQAKACLEQALTLNPGLTAARNDLGRLYREQGELEHAIACFEQALARNPASKAARLNLGMALNVVGAHEDALAQFEACLARDAHDAVALCGAGDASYDLARLADAERYFRETLAVDPQNPGARFGLANIDLVGGRWEAGWAGYEWRKRLPRFAANYESADPSRLPDAVRGKTLVVTAEQGFGDVLLYARFLPRLAKMAGHTAFRCYPELERLMRASFAASGVDVVPLRAAAGGGVPIPVLSLGHVLGIAQDDIPGTIPYLSAPDDARDAWCAKLAPDDRLRVGIAWGANPRRAHHRSRAPAAADYAALAGVENAVFYNLRVGAPADALARFPLPLVDLTPGIRDFADTAALLAGLDLVISIDTSVAHLAGAMGRPLWVLHPGAADWRWEIAGRESPWYPGARLFRREERGWAHALSAVAEALGAMR